MAMRNWLRVLAATLCVMLAPPALAAKVGAATPPAPGPKFDYDIGWMHLPPQWVLGDVSAVAVDRHDNVWVLHRPRTLKPDEQARAAPPVLEFGPDGRFIAGWGGASPNYEWPSVEHSLTVDAQDRVWIAGNSRGNGPSDDMILAFDKEGKFLRQIGKRGASTGDQDTADVKAPADLFVDDARHELYVADGYVNRRVIVFDTETGAFKRVWGAFGKAPPTTPTPPNPAPMAPDGAALNETGPGSDEFLGVHGVRIARDGKVYVSDRANRRIQVFDRAGRYETQAFVARNLPSRLSVSGMGFSPDKAQRWLYVVDYGNNQVAVLDRATLKVVETLGSKGSGAGQFTLPHLLAVDSKGTIYVSEVSNRRVQKIVPRR